MTVMAASDLTPTPGSVVTSTAVSAALDETGSISVDLISSWDDGWQVEGGCMPYRVVISVSGLHGMYSAILPLPPDLDEMMISGFLRQSPVEMVKCQTSDLELEKNGPVLKAICASLEVEDE